ncbi:hypothetical protein OEB96_39660 [Paraliomyxa miuraensis]|nr:hypothetical protein [Paraliomyxa miuraensis]
MQAPRGVFACQRPDGKPLEVGGGAPFSQLYIDDARVEEMPFNEREGMVDDAIIFATHATSVAVALTPGEHTAYCTVLPNEDEHDRAVEPGDAWEHCRTDTAASTWCTRSGTLTFIVSGST